VGPAAELKRRAYHRHNDAPAVVMCLKEASPGGGLSISPLPSDTGTGTGTGRCHGSQK